MISEDEIRTMIPHAGAMCLLQQVETWDADGIRCSTGSHRDPRNPLRSDGMLASLNGLEYGAQAMALHGALLARERGEVPPVGYLAVVRDMKLHAQRLDRLAMPLRVTADSLMVDRGNSIYKVAISAGEKLLVEARVGVMRRTGPTQ